MIVNPSRVTYPSLKKSVRNLEKTLRIVVVNSSVARTVWFYLLLHGVNAGRLKCPQFEYLRLFRKTQP